MQVRTQRWLPSVTPATYDAEARRLLDQAHREYAVAAFASAEASVWQALRQLTTALDCAPSGTWEGAGDRATASESLAIAERAIHEARDFAGRFGMVDAAAIRRLVHSHQTTVLKANADERIIASHAIDRYLDEARVRLSPLAAQRADVAEALDLLAAISLGRNQPGSLPHETSLCLRRAALQGQPGNALLARHLGQQLAQLGLLDEARWTLEHSLSLQRHPQTALALAHVHRQSGDPSAAEHLLASADLQVAVGAVGGAARTPDVIQLSPEQFASVSHSVMLDTSTGTPVRDTSSSHPIGSNAAGSAVALATAQSSGSTSPTEPQVEGEPTPEKPSALRRWANRLGVWR